MLSLLPTPFWDTNTQKAMSGFEPKKYIGEKITLHLSPPCEAEASEIKWKNKELSVRLPPSADNTILSFKGFNFV